MNHSEIVSFLWAVADLIRGGRARPGAPRGEQLYLFARHPRRLLPADREELPREVQQNIDMESDRIQQTGLYRRITDDPAFGAAVKNFLFDQYLRAHRQAEERGDLLIGVAAVGIEHDQLETDDKFMRHLAQVVLNGLGDRAGTCIDPSVQIVQVRTVCVVSCQRSPEPVSSRWKGVEASPDGDFYVRTGPGSVRLAPAAPASTSGRASALAGELLRSAPAPLQRHGDRRHGR